jgi:hypothetical protein
VLIGVPAGTSTWSAILTVDMISGFTNVTSLTIGAPEGRRVTVSPDRQ